MESEILSKILKIPVKDPEKKIAGKSAYKI